MVAVNRPYRVCVRITITTNKFARAAGVSVPRREVFSFALGLAELFKESNI